MTLTMTTRRPYGEMHSAAMEVVELLQPACRGIEVVGSLRRRRAYVRNIDLVAIPTLQTDLFGRPAPDTALDSVLTLKCFSVRKDGPKYKQILYQDWMGKPHQVNIYLQTDPDTWGMAILLKTGSTRFVRSMLTRRRRGGKMPNDLQVRDGRAWRDGRPLPTLEEEDVFALWEMAWITPARREEA